MADSEDKMAMLPTHSNNEEELHEPLVFGDSGGGMKAVARKHWTNHKCAIISGVVGVGTLMIVLISVFVGGQAFAQNAVGTTDIQIQEMIITSFADCPKDYANKCFKSNLALSIDNRNPLAASMHAGTMNLKFKFMYRTAGILYLYILCT